MSGLFAGHIVTNFHVIRNASDVKVALIDQSVYPAKVISPRSLLLLLNILLPAGYHYPQCLSWS